PMRGRLCQALLVAVPGLEARAILRRLLRRFGSQPTAGDGGVAGAPPEGGILGDTLGEDIPRAGKRGLGVRYLPADEGSGGLEGIRALQQQLRQRLEAPLLRHRGPGAAPGTIGEVEVLEFGA